MNESLPKIAGVILLVAGSAGAVAARAAYADMESMPVEVQTANQAYVKEDDGPAELPYNLSGQLDGPDPRPINKIMSRKILNGVSHAVFTEMRTGTRSNNSRNDIRRFRR